MPHLKEREKSVQDMVNSLPLGQRFITETELNAYPENYILWMYIILQRMEKKMIIQKETPQEYVSTTFVRRNVVEVMLRDACAHISINIILSWLIRIIYARNLYQV